MVKNIVSDLQEVWGKSIKDYFRTLDFLAGNKVIAGNYGSHV